MDLKLYNKLKQAIFANNPDLDLSSEFVQKKIEDFDNDILEEDIARQVKRYLQEYNKYLLTKGQKEVRLRYYQILALYFTEYYLQAKVNQSDDFLEFKNKMLAYWMATGSGKTIVMHLNILQYLTKLRAFDKLELIITTPNKNLIKQHQRELEPYCQYLSRLYKNKVEVVISTTQGLLQKQEGYFDLPNNKRIQRLILVDEAHIGLSGKEEGKFRQLRNRLNAKNSFLFEYSATYHNLGKEIISDYENSIVYDYNYNLFYKDGYGKDFWFKEIGEDVAEEDNQAKNQNLTECFEILQDKLEVWNGLSDYDKNSDLFIKGNKFPDKPLIAFMGNTVESKEDFKIKKDGSFEEKDEVSDVRSVIEYLANLEIDQRKNFSKVFNDKITGKLIITRNKNTDDEILLSFGDGEYFGIVNVGNRDGFFNSFEDTDKIQKREGNLVDKKCLFENIDEKESPINVLIGSRKFAEGWNCFRVSIIGLINLGSGKGNKIIQIFGRGVRLKGLKNDGKRQDKQGKVENYKSLNEKDSIKKLETLVVLSLKKSYLKTFTDEIRKQNKIPFSFEIPVQPNIIKLGDKDLNFEEISQKLPIFKLSKKEVIKKQALVKNDGSIDYIYFDNDKIETKTINTGNFNFNLDYRVDKSKNGENIKDSLKVKNSFIDTKESELLLQEFEEETGFSFYFVDLDNNQGVLKIEDVLSLNIIESILYDTTLGSFEYNKIERLRLAVFEEFLRKLRNKINYQINSQNYIFDEKLRQSTMGQKGDFVEKYVITKEFDTQKEVEEFKQEIENLKTKLNINSLDYHLYKPLLNEEENLKIFPTGLNKGEKKFVVDLNDYIKEKYKESDLEFYLFRNVETLKSIGIYLETDQSVFYPDFVFWVLDNSNKKVYFNFVDPKGQTGLINQETLELNDKIISQEVLEQIKTKLEDKNQEFEFILNSFILLRDSSQYGNNQNLEWKKTNIINKNIFRLNWSQTNEEGGQSNLLDNKSYLDLMFEKFMKKELSTFYK
jgi:hypothetical protein